MQRRYRYRFLTRVEFRTAVRHHHFLLRCLPQECGMQHIVSSRCDISGACWQEHGRDPFGNEIVYGSVMDRHKVFTVVSEGEILQGEYVLYGKPEPCYRYATRLTGASDAMALFVRDALDGTDGMAPKAKALALAGALHGRMTYRQGVTSSETTAAEAFALGPACARTTLTYCSAVAALPAYLRATSAD